MFSYDMRKYFNRERAGMDMSFLATAQVGGIDRLVHLSHTFAPMFGDSV